MSFLTRIRPTKSSTQIVLREGEKQQSKENEDVIECPNFNSCHIRLSEDVINNEMKSLVQPHVNFFNNIGYLPWDVNLAS